jgi:group I intron endonuclease
MVTTGVIDMEKRISGVYIIKCTITNEAYIGSCVCIRKRLRDHMALLRGNKHYSALMQKRFNEHGETAFTSYALETCSHNQLLEREQHWLDQTEPTFNTCKIAGKTTGIKYNMPAVSKAKISQALKGKPRKHSVTVYKGASHIQAKKTIRTSKDGEIKIYGSLSLVATDGFIPQNVSKAIKKQKEYQGYKWHYAES